MRRVVVVNAICGGLFGLVLGIVGHPWHTWPFWVLYAIFLAAIANSLMAES